MSELEQNEEEEEEEEELPRFRLPLLEYVKTSQQQNGLRQKDYLRYRRYCARRLHRLRRSLKITHGRKKFQKQKIGKKDVKDERYFCIPLMHAERAWSYSQQLKNEMSNEDPRKQFHMIKRLTKAAKWSDELRNLCEDRADARTSLEAEGYCCWMQGNILLQKEVWDESHEKFVRARQIFSMLAKAGNLEQKALCLERVEEMEPNIKYCSYRRSREPESVNFDEGTEVEIDENLKQKIEEVSNESQMVDDSTSSARMIGDVIIWKGEKVPIRNERIRECVIQNTTFEDLEGKASEKEGEALFNKTLKTLDATIMLVRNELSELIAKRGPQEPTHQEKTLISIRDYLLFQKSKHALKSNERLALSLRQAYHKQDDGGAKKQKHIKPAAIVAAYEQLIQGINSLTGLSAEGLPDDISSKSSEFRATRCFYLAEAYKAVSKWTEAYVLYQKCEKRCSDFMGLIQEEHVETETVDRMKNLEEQAVAGRSFAHARGVIALDSEEKQHSTIVQSGQKQSGKRKILMERLDAYDCGSTKQHHNLVDFPPKFHTTPCKPILFDLAFNEVAFPDISQRVKQKRGGFFGMFAGS